jgi:hypothetical protein
MRVAQEEKGALNANPKEIKKEEGMRRESVCV